MSQTNSCQSGCGCSGNKTIDPNAIKLEESTVDFYKVKQKNYTHFCFDGTSLPLEEIQLNIKLGKNLLQPNDKLVVVTKNSILSHLDLGENFTKDECIMEDNHYYTVIGK